MVQIRYFTLNGVTVFLPNGFRFMPSETELVLQYLAKRMLAIPLPLPDTIYPEIDLRLFNPWELPGEDDDDDQYYFTTVGPVVPARGRYLVRPTASGVWRMKGAEVAIFNEAGQPVGVKRVFNFQRNNNQALPAGPRVSWTMHEYRLLENAAVQAHLQQLAEANGVEVQFGEYYVCKIKTKVRGAIRQENGDDRESCVMYMEEGEDSS